MGNRTLVRFTTPEDLSNIDTPRAMIYLHWGGDASFMDSVFDEFFSAVEEQCGTDTRFTDPSYLAAKFVVWMADQQKTSPDESSVLDFLSVGVDTASVLAAIRSGANTFAVVTASARNLRPRVMVDEALFTDKREIAMHQMTEIAEYLEAQRKNEKEEEDDA
jgi:hypothetical protein